MISPGDFLERWPYEGLLGESYICFRFLCPRCKRTGEAYCEQKVLESALLSDLPGRAPGQELEKFKRMGPITDQELTAFRRALRRFGNSPEDAHVEE